MSQWSQIQWLIGRSVERSIYSAPCSQMRETRDPRLILGICATWSHDLPLIRLCSPLREPNGVGVDRNGSSVVCEDDDIVTGMRMNDFVWDLLTNAFSLAGVRMLTSIYPISEIAGVDSSRILHQIGRRLKLRLLRRLRLFPESSPDSAVASH